MAAGCAPNIAAAKAQLDGAIAGYNDTVLHAVQQTSDQITRLDALARERIDQQQTLEANEAAYSLAEERYTAGLASYLTVLNAKRRCSPHARPWWTFSPIRQSHA